MLKVIISPAKKMKIRNDILPYKNIPFFIKEAEKLFSYMGNMSFDELKDLWKCSDKLVEENERQFRIGNLKQNLSPAILSYEGIQYKYMKPLTFSDSDKEYAQKTIRILSGAYGILKPYDSIYEYRLEMLTKLNVAGTKNLYEYWSDLLYQDLTASDDRIVNLASEEYAKCIRKYVKAPVRFLTCSFKVRKNGVYKTLATAAKMARGQMVHYIITNRISDFEKLKEFDTDGYFYEPSLSSDSEFVFLQR